MKLHTIPAGITNNVTAYTADYLEINRVRFPHSIIFSGEGEIRHWPVTSFTEIDAASLVGVIQAQPELIIIGTGSEQHFLAANIIKPLLTAGIGVELMSTPAAARTYNILVAEGRSVMAALIF